MKAPDVDVLLSDGNQVPLRSLYEHGRLALVFLRHFGCVFCREQVGQLKRLPELNIAFVTLGAVDQAEEFRLKTGSPHRFICDPDRKLHALFDVRQGGLAQLFSPQVVVRGISAMMNGYFSGTAQGDVKQLPGVFLIESDGSVTWEHRATNAADQPSPKEIRRRLTGA